MDRDYMIEVLKEFKCHGIECRHCPLRVVSKIAEAQKCPANEFGHHLFEECTDDEIRLLYHLAIEFERTQQLKNLIMKVYYSLQESIDEIW